MQLQMSTSFPFENQNRYEGFALRRALLILCPNIKLGLLFLNGCVCVCVCFFWGVSFVT
jgi:hypothetical protein